MFSFSSKKKTAVKATNGNENTTASSSGATTTVDATCANIHATFLRKKTLPANAKEGLELLQSHVDRTLGNNESLRDAVKLPRGEDELEWIAVNVVDFFHAVTFLYDMVHEHCTEQTCPTMCAGPKFEYRWADGEKIVKPIDVPAPKYVGLLFRWIENQIDDAAIFPKRQGEQFPKDFRKRAKKITTRMFRVYAHLYHSHFKIICALSAEKHLNTVFKHFVYFAVEFSLISSEEMLPLSELVDEILRKD